jgi:uncharacterized protein involved in high-affinity Fe2+ transport
MKHLTLVAVLLILGLIAGCGDTSEVPVDEIIEEVEIEATQEESEPEVATIAIPDELKDLVLIPEGFIITKFDVVDEAKKQYHIEADVRDNVDNVQNSFIKLYAEGPWENDVNMSQKGNTTTGFNNGDFMVFIDANKGNIGSIVKIDTGLL